MDRVEWIAVDVALGKAYTAAAFQTASEDLAERSAAVPLLAQSMTTITGGRFVPQKGGLPIVVGGVCVGGVGASGASGDDVAVLEVALEALGEHPRTLAQARGWAAACELRLHDRSPDHLP